MAQGDKTNLLATIRDWRTTISSLENRNYRWYWLSTLASFTAMQMELVVRGLLVYELTDSAMALGWVSAGFGVPMLLFSLLGGAIVDRVDKRNLIIINQALTGIATLVIAVLISTGAIALWHLIIASIASGVILSFNLPGRQAIIPQLVEKQQIMNAVALGSGAMNSTRVFAPAIGGVLVGIMGIDGVYYLMVVCYVVSVVLMLMVTPLGRPALASNATVGSAIGEGLGYVRRSPILVLLLALAFVPMVFGMPYQVLMPIFALDVLDVGRSGLGYLLSMAGIGALAASIVVASLGDFRHKGLLLLGTSALFGLFLILFAESTSYTLSLLFLLGVGAANAAYMASNNTLLQINADDNMRGRVMSLYMMTVGLMPLGTLGAAAIAESVDAPFAIVVGGAVIVLFTLVMAVLIPNLRKL